MATAAAAVDGTAVAEVGTAAPDGMAVVGTVAAGVAATTPDGGDRAGVGQDGGAQAFYVGVPPVVVAPPVIGLAVPPESGSLRYPGTWT